MNGPMPGDEPLEARVRELLFDGGTRREELNELLREHEEARPIAARLLLEDAALISHLRVDNARRWAEVLQPPNVRPADKGRASNPPRLHLRRRIGVLAGLAAACLVAVLWIQRDQRDKVASDTVAIPDAEKVIGWLRPVRRDTLSGQAVPVVEGREIELESARARIDLDNGVVLSITGPARMMVSLEGTRLWQGQIVVDVPPNLRFYIIETDEGRFVDLGTVFSVSAQPNHQTEMAVLSGKVRAELTTSDGDILQKQLVKEAEGVVIERDGSGFRKVMASDLRHDVPISPDNSSLPVSATYRAAVDASEPMMVWDFDEIPTGKRVLNRQGPDFAGLVEGELHPGEGGGVGRFLRFGQDGGSGWIDGDSFWRKPDPQPFTLELWARPDQIQWGHLLNLRIDAERDPVSGRIPRGLVSCFFLEFTSSGVFGQKPDHPAVRAGFRSPATEHADKFLPGGVNATLSSPDRYVPGRWYHLVARVGPQDFTLFVNGSIAAQQTISRPDHGEQELHLRLGRLFDDGNKSRQFVGAIDEVAIYDHTLSDEEVLKHYQAMAADGE